MRSNSTMENGRVWPPTATRVGRSVTGGVLAQRFIITLAAIGDFCIQLKVSKPGDCTQNARAHSAPTQNPPISTQRLHAPCARQQRDDDLELNCDEEEMI
jgi:hypothetical protein